MNTARRKGESLEHYRERMWRRAIRPSPVVKGVASAQGTKTWQRAQSTGLRDDDWRKLGLREKEEFTRLRAQAEAEEHREAEALRSSVDPIRKRTGAERLKSLCDRLVSGAEETYRQTGKVVLPASVMDAISRELAAQGKFHDPAKLAAMSLEQVRRAIESWSHRLLTQAARKSANDRVPEVRGA